MLYTSPIDFNVLADQCRNLTTPRINTVDIHTPVKHEIKKINFKTCKCKDIAVLYFVHSYSQEVRSVSVYQTDKAHFSCRFSVTFSKRLCVGRCVFVWH